MQPDSTAHLLRLVTIALDEFESVPVAGTVRRAWQIAGLRGDTVCQLRFSLELGLEETADLVGLLPAGVPALDESSVEASLMFLNGRAIGNVRPGNLGLSRIEDLTYQPIDGLLVDRPEHEDRLSFQSQIEDDNRRNVAERILARIRNETFCYLVSCSATLRVAESGERIFDRHRARVDRHLRTMAPEVLDMLNAAVRRAAEEDEAEARSHALTSCRRVLMAVADLVFRPQQEEYHDGADVPRPVGRANYRNRIVAAVEQAGSTTLHTALSSAVEDLANRLDKLDELTQKGVHGNPTPADVDFGVIQTYLLAGEVLAACDTA